MNIDKTINIPMLQIQKYWKISKYKTNLYLDLLIIFGNKVKLHTVMRLIKLDNRIFININIKNKNFCKKYIQNKLAIRTKKSFEINLNK